MFRSVRGCGKVQAAELEAGEESEVVDDEPDAEESELLVCDDCDAVEETDRESVA